jgi:hypothetical protein
VVGIGAGIPSGFIATFVTQRLFSKKENREYLEKLRGANQEVIFAARSAITNDTTPTREIIRSLIRATSQKDGVARTDMHNSSQIFDHLIKEIMDSSFLTPAMKKEYCERILAVKAPPAEQRAVQLKERANGQAQTRLEDNSLFLSYREKSRTQLSMFMGLTVGLMIVFTTVIALIIQRKDICAF